MTKNAPERLLLEVLGQSVLFQEYQRAFTATTGLPLALQPPDTWQLPHQTSDHAGSFCALLTSNSQACADCLTTHQRLLESATQEPQCLTCPNGLRIMAAPLKLDGRLLGFLQTGQAFRKKPTRAHFARLAKQLARWGIELPPQRLRASCAAAGILDDAQAEGILKLLALFAQHLLVIGTKFMQDRAQAEPEVVARAKQYIHAHFAANLRLGQVARACAIGKFQLCRAFSKATGTNFSDYVSQVRVKAAKDLLLNQNLRITEIAFHVGFQSVTHFDRVFKRLLGQSPRDYRRRLLRAP